MDLRDVIIRPIITEKALRYRDNYKIYVFEVHMDANKSLVKEAVEKLFDVKVEKVRTCIMKPKPRSNIRNRRRTGYTKTWKKAYVKLKEGYSIKALEGV
ncbi:MAG: 50S ribosomal protein L23 [candidate division WOR-3 bacterium]|nr:50S ribosomal protein L23 [candidate division WOR-3 bacterium]MCX7947938.1 50S ribosomal protein L23 [candidate division WOR-3 bacterium]MDW8150882.1 50S ribosomal protein L23 [candidate division WOR-3 bacterium]